MGLRIQIHGANEIDDGVWKARIPPSELRFIDSRASTVGNFSVVLLMDDFVFDEEQSCLSFNPLAAKLLNAGASDTVILMGSRGNDNDQHLPLPDESQSFDGVGDQRFLQSLQPNLKALGQELLREVRKNFAGDLAFFPKSGKYVEAPDNFWTIRPQHRDGSFRITVRGRPESFHGLRALKLKPDMGGYSSFKLNHLDQIEEFIRLLSQVRRK